MPSLRIALLCALYGLASASPVNTALEARQTASSGDETGDDNPLTGGDNPLTGGDNPLTSGGNPLTGGDNPLIGGDNPLIGGDNPLTGGDNPLTGGDNPLTGGDNPLTGGDNPISGGFGMTRNDLKNGKCKGTMIVYARGTTEPGNVGIVTGPPFFDALSKKVNGDLAVQGVDYPAGWGGAVTGGDLAGTETMKTLIKQATEKCPDANIVISGYSQGAQLVHKAASSLDPGVTDKISAAVVFGDPYNPQKVKGVSNLLSVCHAADPICIGGSGLGDHLTYSSDADKAANFVVQHASKAGGGSSTPPLPATPAQSSSSSTSSCSTQLLGLCL